MRVKLDENLPIQLKRLFTESGHDAATVVDEGLGGASDTEIAAICSATTDSDSGSRRRQLPRRDQVRVHPRLSLLPRPPTPLDRRQRCANHQRDAHDHVVLEHRYLCSCSCEKALGWAEFVARGMPLTSSGEGSQSRLRPAQARHLLPWLSPRALRLLPA